MQIPTSDEARHALPSGAPAVTGFGAMSRELRAVAVAGMALFMPAPFVAARRRERHV